METSGAYELVDEESGEKLIVWGGSDEDPLVSPIPPKHLLQSSNWNGDNDDVDSPKKSSSSFSRLKAQKVRALATKTQVVVEREVRKSASSSASALRGWGGGRSQFQSTDNLQRKFNSDKDFFSRKSFKDLGCAPYLIHSLKEQNFLRPSQIQVYLCIFDSS